jgi:hypothetical protein
MLPGEPLHIKPRFNTGDVLWVKETWRCNGVGKAGSSEFVFIKYKTGEIETINVGSERALYYAGKGRVWKPSIRMPRDASRLFLEVKSVRIERVQDISEADAKAEGVDISHCFCGVPEMKDKCHKHKFMMLWDNLYDKTGYSRESNPWVYVIEFMRLDPVDMP